MMSKKKFFIQIGSLLFLSFFIFGCTQSEKEEVKPIEKEGIVLSQEEVKDEINTEVSSDPVLENKTSSDRTKVKATMLEVINFKKPQKCIYETEINGRKNSGTVYSDGEKGRINFEVEKEDGEKLKSHAIYKDSITHIWSDKMSTGIRMLDSEVNFPGFEEFGNVLDFQKELEYECQSLEVDPILFEIPKDKQFIPIDDEMINLMDVMGIKDVCKACQEISDSKLRNLCIVEAECDM